jgi:hypothetical protein
MYDRTLVLDILGQIDGALQAYAQENWSRIIQRLPPRLSAREDRDPTDRAAHQAAKAGGARAGPRAGSRSLPRSLDAEGLAVLMP